MLKKTIKYTDYNGKEREEDFYFGVNKAELTEMEYSEEGGFDKYLTKILKEENAKEIMNTVKRFILKSYGEKSEDGKRFVKSEELSLGFAQTEAYSELFIEICSNPDKATEFILGILPDSIREEIKKEIEKTSNKIDA